MNSLFRFCSNKVVYFISMFLPLFIVVNHFTSSVIILVVSAVLLSVIGMFSNFDVTINNLLGILGCIFVFTDGYSPWVPVVYLIFVLPKYILFIMTIINKGKNL